MAQLFEVKPIRKVGSNGVLEGVGLEWTEEPSLRSNGRLGMWFAFAIAAPAAVIFFAVGGVGTVGALVFAASAAWILNWQFGALPRRSIVFRRDGTITAPNGLPGQGGALRLTQHQADLASIEVGPCFSGLQQDWTSSVQFVAASGLTTTVSQKLHREEARQIAVRLNLALKELRQGAAAVRSTAVPAKSRQLVD